MDDHSASTGCAPPGDGRGFDILHEDDSLLAVVKPAGVPTQAPREFESLESRIRAYLAGGDLAAAANLYLGIPHRLDRPVSGAMVFAKTRRAARQLARQFQRRSVTKLYWAAVEGVIEPRAGTWTDYLWKVYGRPLAQVVEHTHPDGQEAILHYRAIGRHRHGSWLQIELETGRTHQVRVQAGSRGWPIVGDDAYGSRTALGTRDDDPRKWPIALHAWRLTVAHPTTREPLVLEAPLPATWEELALARIEEPT